MKDLYTQNKLFIYEKDNQKYEKKENFKKENKIKMLKSDRVYTTKSVLLSLAIAVAFVVFIILGVSTFYPEPKYESYCNFTYIEYTNQSACENAGGAWNPSVEKVGAAPSQPVRVAQGYCDLYKKCNDEYTVVREKYTWKVFIFFELVGLIAITIGVFYSFVSISTGLMGGGVFLLLYSSIRYWGEINKILRFSVICIVLLVLIFLAFKKFKK